MKASKSYNSRYQRDIIQSYLNNNAIVIDVRSQQEWDLAHIDSFKHIEFRNIKSKLNYLKELNKPIIAVCISGMRSGQVTDYLKREGLDIINGGSWQNVAELIF
ncbi:rhodanese-like domain-containing protein [Tenacibaculum sp. 190524A02b]|uniref:rhodanese-like domain-containing protein n=1 Tax=Tenacibaculum vairaonense TaxID=3137860 RepID=UPI0031FB1D4B